MIVDMVDFQNRCLMKFKTAEKSIGLMNSAHSLGPQKYNRVPFVVSLGLVGSHQDFKFPELILAYSVLISIDG